MLNAKSGLVDFLKPSAPIAADKRQGGVAQESDGMFGDTLRGQMRRGAEACDENVSTTSAAEGASQGRAQAATGKPAAAVTDSAVMPQDESADDMTDAGLAEATLMAQLADVPDVAATPTAQVVLAEVPADAAVAWVEEGNGKDLPLPLPQLAAAEDAVALPRWLPLQGLERVRGALSAAAEQPAALTRTEPREAVTLEQGLLQGLRAVIAQGGGDAESQLGEGGHTGQNTGALFKLAGLSVGKEQSLAPAVSSAAATAATLLPPVPGASASMPQLAVDVSVRQTGWDQAFAERVVWLAKQGLQQAEIQLHPRNLGPIEVHVHVDKDQASVVFLAQHASTREALEAALPRLREMLQGNGLNLAQSEVSQHSPGQQQRESMGFTGEQGGRREDGSMPAEQEEETISVTTLEGGRGLSAVDYYA